MPPRPWTRQAAAWPNWNSSSGCRTKAFPAWHSGAWELEQQVLKYEAVLASQGADTEQGALLLPQLFYDSGSGFSPHECLTVAPDSYDELTHEVSAVFELPVEARALRLDPGEFACCITDFSLSDERLSYHIINGNALQEGTMLFMNIDPNLTVESAVGFPAGLRFAVKYRYYPLAAT